MARRILTAALALGPLVILLHYTADLSEEVEFVLASLALIPLAWLIGEATEHASHHTGAGIGGFLNATFGNAPELIIALIAVNEGLTEVVRGSLTGSVVGNLLLVLGFSLALGGTGELDRRSSFTSLALVGLATVAFLIPSIPGWEGDPDRHSLAVVTLPVSIALLSVYVAVTWLSLRRHRGLHVSDEAVDGAEIARRMPVEPLRPLPIWTATRENGTRALVPGRAPLRLSCPVEHEPRGDERSGSAPHDLVGFVADVLPDARVERLGEIRARRKPERHEKDPGLAREEGRLARFGHVRPAPKIGSHAVTLEHA